jgi:hypothetical protein
VNAQRGFPLFMVFSVFCRLGPGPALLSMGTLAVAIHMVAAGVVPTGGGLRGWNTFDGYLGPSNETAFIAGMECVPFSCSSARTHTCAASRTPALARPPPPRPQVPRSVLVTQRVQHRGD